METVKYPVVSQGFVIGERKGEINRRHTEDFFRAVKIICMMLYDGYILLYICQNS